MLSVLLSRKKSIPGTWKLVGLLRRLQVEFELSSLREGLEKHHYSE